MRLLLGPVLLIGVVVAVVYATVHASRRRTARSEVAEPSEAQPARSTPATVRPPSEQPALDDQLGRWRAAGLLSEQQSAAILAYEQSQAAPAPAPAPAIPEAPPAAVAARRVPVVAEALGYLGGMLAIIGLVLVVAQYWPDMPTVGRLMLSGAGALGLLVAGALLHEESDPALARLRGFLWLASTAAAGLFAGVLADDAFGVEQVETIVLVCAVAVALESVLLWARRERPIQQLTFLGGVAVIAGALVAEVAEAGPVGLAVWIVGAVYLLLGLRRRTPLPLLTYSVGALALVVGAAITVDNWPGFGLPFIVATAGGLLALAVVPGLAPDRGDQVTAAVLGGVALLQSVPSTIGYFSPDAGAATGVTTWLVGCGLVFLGARRLVRVPVVVEALGGLAIIGGAALTGFQWPGFAPIFGLVTAVGLIAIGMLPGQVLMSVFGALGLLVNVPWAIGWYFPGEGRAPLLILVSGALIVAVAIVLTRMGDRFRHELGPSDRAAVRSKPASGHA